MVLERQVRHTPPPNPVCLLPVGVNIDGILTTYQTPYKVLVT